MKLDLKSVVTSVDGLALLAIFFVALIVVRLPLVILLQRALGGRGALAVALLSATTLSLIVVITQVAVEGGVMPSSQASPMVVAGMLTVILFPAQGFRLAAISPVARPDANDREGLYRPPDNASRNPRSDVNGCRRRQGDRLRSLHLRARIVRCVGTSRAKARDLAEAGRVFGTISATGSCVQRSGLAPTLLLQQHLDPSANLVPNLANSGDRLALGVLERPIVAPQTGHHWTLIAATHRDEPFRLPHQFRRQLQRSSPREIGAHLVHRGNDLRMNAWARIGARRDRLSLDRIRQQVEPGRGHLGATGVVNAGEEHRLHDADASERGTTT
jgi:hypothetical protein